MRHLLLPLFLLFSHLDAATEDAVQSIASLIASLEEPSIGFTEEDVNLLFEKARSHLECPNLLNDLYAAQEHYETEEGQIRLNNLWTLAAQKNSLEEKLQVHSSYPGFSDNPLFDSHERKLTKPYLVPINSPIKPILDHIFATRVTFDLNTLKAGGFHVFSSRPRSFIQVSRNAALPGYVFKIYLDTLMEEKQGIPGWRWLIHRCKGAQTIAKIIKKKNFHLVTVPKKWIYPLPYHPLAPAGYKQKSTVLIAEEMPLVSDGENWIRWNTEMSKEHLKELYVIISRAASIRPRPDNVWFLPDGRVALVDTEYSFRAPDLVTIRAFLKPELLSYWDELVKKG